MKSKLGRKITLFLVISFLPFTFFYIFSRGSQHYQRLPFLGPEQSDSIPFVFPDFTFHASGGKNISKKDLQGKIIIATCLQSSCPDNCLLIANPFRLEVYNLITKNKKFSDVVILSELLDTAIGVDLMPEKMKVDPERWMMFTADKNPFWDVELNGSILREQMDNERPGERFYPRSVLLIDTSFRLRGFYDGSQPIEIKRLIDELRLLKKEYDADLL